MDEYKGPTKRTYTVILLSVILLPLGYFGIYFLQIQSGPLATFQSKYSEKNRIKICSWNENSSYLNCMRKDFYKLIRSTGPFQGQKAFLYVTDIFREDRDKQVSELGKVNVYLDYIDLSISFLEIERRFRLSRTKLNIPGILLAKLNKDSVLEEINLFPKHIKKLETKYKSTIESDKLLIAKYQRLKKNYLRIKDSLK